MKLLDNFFKLESTMMYIRYLVVVVFLGVSLAQADDKKLVFIDANFDDFAVRVSKDDQERQMFKVYFANLVQKIQEAHENDPQKEKATYRYLYSLAMRKLEEKHGSWFQEIQPFVSDARFTLDEQLDEVRRVIKFFLTRYGAYEEFLNYQIAHAQNNGATQVADSNSKGIWETVKDYAVNAKNKVAGWFGFGSERVV